MEWRFEYIDSEKILKFIEKTENWDEEKQRKFYFYLMREKDKIFQSELGLYFLDVYAKKIGITGEQIAQKKKEEQVPKRQSIRLFFWKVLPLFLLIIAVSTGSIWGYRKFEEKDAEKHLETLQETMTGDKADQIILPQEADGAHVASSEAIAEDYGKQRGLQETAGDEKPVVLEQYRELANQYPELFGWLTIPNTGINYPVMQSAKEKDYYLNHNYEGTPDDEGALFVDPASSSYPMDDNVVIYGHNMKNGHMFGELKNYGVESYFQANRELFFHTLYEIGSYEVVTVVQTHIKDGTEDGFRYYQFFNYETHEEFQECVDFIQENQIYDAENTLQFGDRLLMLSTCDYAEENGRFVVIARKKGE